jgi:chloramphenicol-sensitive protein RarD
MSPAIIDAEKNKAGILYGASSFALWGILPLYWKLLQAVPPLEILYHRIFWSFVVMVAVVFLSNKWNEMLVIFSDFRKLAIVFLCGILISVNWYIYIYAVNTDQVIEASMGYYMNPLVVVLLGVTVFKERLNRWQLSAIALAALGVIIVTVQYGRVPWIALVLACSFATYGLAKKMVAVDSIIGLTTETLIVMPVALFFILKLETSGTGTFVTAPFALSLVLAGSGIVTATPLLLYARGIEKTTFSMIGFLQYIAPSINLFLGIFVFREHFTLPLLISFCFIWAGLVIFTMSNVGILKESLPVQAGK